MPRIAFIAVIGAILAAGIVIVVAVHFHNTPASPQKLQVDKHGKTTVPGQSATDSAATEKTPTARETGPQGSVVKTGEDAESESDDPWGIGPIDPNSPAALYMEAFKLMIDPMDEQFAGKTDEEQLAQFERIDKILAEGWNEDYPEIIRVLEANREALAKLKAAIDAGGYFPTPEDADFRINFSHLMAARCAATLLGLEARFFEKEGDIENAARNIADGIKFSQDIVREGPVISDLVGIAIQKRFLDLINSEICKERPNLRFCSAIERSLYDLEYTQEFIEKGLEVEKRMFEQSCRNLPSMDKEELKLLLGKSNTDSMNIEKSINIYRDYYKELTNALKAGLRPAMKKSAEIREQMESKAKELPDLFLIMCPAFDSYLKNKGHRIVSYEMARTGTALELHKAANGGYPDSLSELVPKYLPRVPIDPFSGKPLGYGKGGKGWTLHSFGFDMDNDNAEKEAKNSSSDGDIILRKK